MRWFDSQHIWNETSALLESCSFESEVDGETDLDPNPNRAMAKFVVAGDVFVSLKVVAWGFGRYDGKSAGQRKDSVLALLVAVP